MSVNLKGRSFLTLRDLSAEEILHLLDFSSELKAEKKRGIRGKRLEGKNIVLIFEKTSTRTRCAFEAAAYDEGGRVTFLTNSQMGVKESTEDTARVLGRYYDGIEFRGSRQETVEQLAEHAGIPVWNGLSDRYHPTQILAENPLRRGCPEQCGAFSDDRCRQNRHGLHRRGARAPLSRWGNPGLRPGYGIEVRCRY